MKTIAHILFAISLLGIGVNVNAFTKEQALDSFNLANEKYKAQEYQRALNIYKGIFENGFESADLFYNMGNAYYKNDSFPLSIWCYEKALLLDPNFKEAKKNLEIANLSLADKVEELPRIAWWYYWKKFKNLFTLKGWTVISVVSLWIMILGVYLLITHYVHWFKRLGVYLIFVGLVFTLLTGFIAASKAYQLKNPGVAIVITSNVYAKSAPEQNSADLFIIHSGLKVEIEDQIGEWIKIKLSDGKTGWVVQNDLKSL